jgi:hypothetical protein
MSDMAEKAKGKKTTKKETKKATKIHVPNKLAEDDNADEAKDEGFKAKAEPRPKAKAKSSSKSGTEEIEVEDLVDGVVGVFGDGLGTVIDKSAVIGGGVLSDATSVARSAVSTVMDGIVKAAGVVNDAVGTKDPGFRDKG